MKRILPFCVLTLALALPARAQQDGLPPDISQCLRDNAAAVETAEPDLTKATDFLVLDACALPVAREQQRQNTQRLKEAADRNRALCLDRVAQQKQQDQAAARPGRSYENCDLNYNNAVANSPLLPVLAIPQRNPAAIALAAKLILDLRVAHNKPRP